ncbi:hypothetical protein AUC68_04025 [Methyloceanibacter methanicus]|uniref:PhnB-like domain-containing protein n=1 Tax=Methyloceanibacter methanicus TaxID=1774968 RepID=A0A1E3W174_9HYPH|nr:VOC family protein [Methyloceanibacter methanicus]ODR99503.1 hypothetical protein AUC68_04025 [Methyloceanibacter methanicus]
MRLNPYLNFPGTCREAFTAYQKILGGDIVAMMTFAEMPGDYTPPPELKDMIAHARLAIGDQVLMASDAGPDHYKPMQGTSVTLNIDDPDEAERTYATLAEGGAAEMPLQETFWAFKFGTLTDRFGTRWMINCMKPD